MLRLWQVDEVRFLSQAVLFRLVVVLGRCYTLAHAVLGLSHVVGSN